MVLLGSLLTVLGSGCSSVAHRFDRTAASLGLECHELRGTEFSHRVCANRPTAPAPSLHVYLEGDGLPWRTRTAVSPDPTPRAPVVLDLMAADETPALYLGRPCYHGLTGRSCSPLLWTHERYSETVVASMAAAIRRTMAERHAQDLVLFGYSGGGVLAMLLAERLEATRAVVTVAANLDIDAWADLHEFTRLEGSLNPADRPPLAPAIRQLHLAGAKDLKVPAGLVEAAVRRQREASVRVLPGFDHTCCWSRIWPEILAWAAEGS